MKKFPIRQFILIALILALLGGITFFVYQIVQKRYFSKPQASIQSNPPIAFHDLKEAAKKEPPTAPIGEFIPTSPGEENAATPRDGKRNVKTYITRNNCDEGCKSFEADPVLFTYCQQVCGLAPAQTEAVCDTKTGLEKDYCQKDLAISKTDSASCETILDDNIRKTCHNRIAEDVLEKVGAGTDPNYR